MAEAKSDPRLEWLSKCARDHALEVRRLTTEESNLIQEAITASGVDAMTAYAVIASTLGNVERAKDAFSDTEPILFPANTPWRKLRLTT